MMHQQRTQGMSCPRPLPMQLNSNQIRVLEQQGFTSGLIQAVSTYANTVALRIWVVDNSVSMQIRDGHRLSGSTFQGLQKSDCSRWEEAHDRVAFHVYMAGCLGFPTRFNMVDHSTIANLPSCFSVAEHGSAAIQQEIQAAKQLMSQIQPKARAAPLTFHVMKIREMIVQMAPQLSREGKSLSVVLLTSGLPTDNNGQASPNILQEFVQALRSLEGLPVWVVVRLTTDDESVVDFFNMIDAQINLPYDVLDDFHGEAVEVYLRNPWLNYSLPLHQFRELGFPIPVFDEIDERALSLSELQQLCALLFRTHQPLPDPASDWISFMRALSQVILSQEKMHYNPVTKVLGPWIDLRRLHLVYGYGMPFPHDIPVSGAPQQQYYQQPSTHQQQWQQKPQGFAGSQGQQQFQQSQAFHQQQRAPAQQQQPPPPPAPEACVSASKYERHGSADDSMANIKRCILTWATVTPAHQELRSIDQLLGSIPETFPPAFGTPDHDYFQKWKPFAVEALHGRDEAVLKRAMRKTKFFLHPDKLPNDLTKGQAFLFRMLWDIIQDAWEAFEEKR